MAQNGGRGGGPYNSEFVNEVHRLFPALLYDNQSFRSIHEIFDYVNRQMRRNYDVFSNNRQEYFRQYMPQDPHPNTPNRRPRNDALPPLPRRQRVGRPQEAPPVYYNQGQRVAQQSDVLPDELSEGTIRPIIANLLNSLLTQPIQAQTWTYNIEPRGIIPGWGGEGTHNSFLEPVPVPPTPEILRNNTTVYVLAENSDTQCVVCQDSMEQGVTVRKLTTCGHTFHRTCVDTWFQSNVHCPTCRHDIREARTVATTVTVPSSSVQTR